MPYVGGSLPTAPARLAPLPPLLGAAPLEVGDEVPRGGCAVRAVLGLQAELQVGAVRPREERRPPPPSARRPPSPLARRGEPQGGTSDHRADGARPLPLVGSASHATDASDAGVTEAAAT